MTAAIAFVLGLVVGSFLNVVISRYPQEQIITGRSRCPHCRATLKWRETIPLFSFITLRGRCHRCSAPISWRYPLVELITGLGFALIGISLLESPFFSLWLVVLFTISVLIFFYDLHTLTIPDPFVIVFFIVSAVGIILFERDTIVIRALSGVALGAFFWILFAVSRGRWIGGGDVRLGFVLGFWLGWPAATVALFGAYLLGLVVVLPLLLFGKTNSRSRIAFGPFLIASAWIAFLWGKEILNWYLSLIS